MNLAAQDADGALVVRARAGDTTAFEQLLRRYAGPVYRVTLRILHNAHDAEDAAQDTFVIAWRRLHDVRAEQAFAAWLYRVAATRALQAARSRCPQADLETVPPSASPSGNPEQEALADDLLGALRRALTHLTPQQRACWVLKELEGLSYDQIAEATQAGPEAVRGRIHRARARLAAELTPWR